MDLLDYLLNHWVRLLIFIGLAAVLVVGACATYWEVRFRTTRRRYRRRHM